MPCYGAMLVPNRQLLMPLLQPLERLTFHEAAHRYAWDGEWLPWSVTQIVSDLTPEAKAQIDATKDGPDGWAIRGTTVHSCLEAFLLGEAELNPGDFGDWTQPLLDHWLWKDCEVLAVEYRLVDPIKRVAGSFDALIKTAQGTTCLLDLKTVKTAPAAKSRKPALSQLGAYVSMLAVHHPYLTIDRCATVISGPGTTVVKTSEVDACVAAWEDAWGRHQAEQDMLGF